MPKFNTVDEYYQWCDTIITKIYYANIAMNDQGIQDAIAKIASVLHIPEGESLIAVPHTDEDELA